MALKVFTSRPMLKGPQGIASMQEVFRLTSKGLGKIVKPDDIHPRRSERPAHSRQASSSSYNMHHRRGRSPMPRVSGTSKLYWKTAVEAREGIHKPKRLSFQGPTIRNPASELVMSDITSDTHKDADTAGRTLQGDGNIRCSSNKRDEVQSNRLPRHAHLFLVQLKANTKADIVLASAHAPGARWQQH
ncbi:hypothetical protein PMIN01_11296 [Paraphaeosphaeria minitans]|uniref:Uncharacterized protein n=1 Tax=Paraphaeosphaeria minitans TaxID=565426 RepID=A0A9P6G7A8_9PLEO|nr:hypothetical protein PMIN01_11296 [Paraphaeosphaeria minitans]